MSVLKFQLNTPVEITRDLTMQVIDQATGRQTDTTPFLDGSANFRNLAAGNYRLLVKHPHLPFAVVDRPIRVLPGGGPTFVPIVVDLDQFRNTPVRDIPDADLAPVRTQLEDAGDAAERQAAKRGGEPIFADDWNVLAGAVTQVTAATVDLTRRVSPQGHDHPEIVDKLDEIQANLQDFLEVFGQSMAQLQRQIQEVALQQRADRALDAIPNVPPAKREAVTRAIDRLAQARNDNPYNYMREQKRAGETLTNEIFALLPIDQPDIAALPAVADLVGSAQAMAQATPAATYEAEVRAHLRVDKGGPGNIAAILNRGRQ